MAFGSLAMTQLHDVVNLALRPYLILLIAAKVVNIKSDDPPGSVKADYWMEQGGMIEDMVEKRRKPFEKEHITF